MTMTIGASSETQGIGGVPAPTASPPFEGLRPLGLTIAAVCVYTLLTHLMYKYATIVDYGYQGLSYDWPRPRSYLAFAMLIGLATCLLLPRQLTRPSASVLWWLYLTVVVPCAFVPFVMRLVPPSRMLLWPLVLFAAFVILRFGARAPVLRLPQIKVSPLLFMGGLIGISALVVAYAIVARGLQFHNLMGLYAYRALLAEEAAESQAVQRMMYLYIWQSCVIGPLLLVIGLARRNWAIYTFAFFAHIVMFSATSVKYALFAPLLVTASYWVLRRRPDASTSWSLWQLNKGIIAGIGLDLTLVRPLTDRMLINGFLMRRIVHIPGYLSMLYFDFFSRHPKTAFLEVSAVRVLQEIGPGLGAAYPYLDTPRRIVAYHYFGEPRGLNANCFAAGFADYGFMGVIVITAVLAIALWLWDTVAAGHSFAASVAVMALPVYALSNSALPTVFLTYGMGLLMVLMYLAPPHLFRPPAPCTRAVRVGTPAQQVMGGAHSNEEAS